MRQAKTLTRYDAHNGSRIATTSMRRVRGDRDPGHVVRDRESRGATSVTVTAAAMPTVRKAMVR